MKQKMIYSLSVAAVLLATACTDDLGVQDIPAGAGKGNTLKVEATMNSSSRMTVQNNGAWIDYYWTADDAFTVFDSKHSQQTEFVVDVEALEENSSNTDFIGTPDVAYEDGQTLYAVYSKNGEMVKDANGNLTLDLNGQDGRLNERFQYMFAETVYHAGKPINFGFRHLVTTLQVKLAVPEGVNSLSNVTLRSNHLVSKATLVLNKAPYDSESQFKIGDLVYPYTDNGNFEFGDITLNGTFTPKDGYVTLYFYTLASKQYYDNVTWYDESWITPAILYTDEKGTQHVTTEFLGQRSLEVGAVYGMEINKSFELVDFANEDQVDGSMSHPFEISNEDQFYSMMLRCHYGLKDKNYNWYRYRSYKLMDDMVLDDRSLWYPVQLEHAVFDGNGRTVSGKFSINVHGRTGFFGWLYDAVVQDLTLDADISYSSNGGHWTVFGGIVAEMEYRSKILRCYNNSRISFGYEANGTFGGIVGRLGHYSYVEYCGFSGSFSSENNDASVVGGIVGYNNSWSSNNPIHVIGCYSDGSFHFGRFSGGAWLGGIFGELIGDPNAEVKYCWSNTTFSSAYEDESTVLNFGGIAGQFNLKQQHIQSCYWNNSIAEWTGVTTDFIPDNSASFEGTMPTAAQLKELNTGIMASGLMFSEENGHLVKNNQTVVPPSDIENW